MGARHAYTFTEHLMMSPPLGTFWRESAVGGDDKTERVYKLFSIFKKDLIVEFRARELPGCCGVLVVYYLRPQRSKGQGHIFVKMLSLIVKTAKKAKYGAVLLSQTRNSLGYKLLCSYPEASSCPDFINGKTGNSVGVWVLSTGWTAPKIKEHFDDE